MRRVLVVLALLAVLAAVWFAGVDADSLRRHHDMLLAFTEQRPLLARLVFALAVAGLVAIGIPGLILLNAFGGYLFGWFAASALSLPAHVLGACAAFLLARTALAAPLRARASRFLPRVEAAVRADGVYYVIALRLMGVLPIAVRNFVPALVGIPLRTFALGTAIGQAPATLVYTNLGDALGPLLAAEELPEAALYDPQIVFALAGLALLALVVPLVRRLLRWRRVDRPAAPQR